MTIKKHTKTYSFTQRLGGPTVRMLCWIWENCILALFCFLIPGAFVHLIPWFCIYIFMNVELISQTKAVSKFVSLLNNSSLNKENLFIYSAHPWSIESRSQTVIKLCWLKYKMNTLGSLKLGHVRSNQLDFLRSTSHANFCHQQIWLNSKRVNMFFQLATFIMFRNRKFVNQKWVF